MNKAIAIVAGLALLMAAGVGCQKGMKGGGEAKGTAFSINVPNMAQEIRQGEVKTITIKLSRADYFKEDVQLTIQPPEGLTIEPTGVMVKASDPPTVQLRIAAPQNAALGSYKVRLTGQPQTGAPATAEFAVKVVAPGQ